jgi:hypothetical protein
MKNRNEQYKKEFLNQVKSYITVNGIFIVAFLFLFVPLSQKLLILKIGVIWAAFLISSIIIIVKKEYPRLPPYKSIIGSNAVIIGYVLFFVVFTIGLLFLILGYFYS